MCMTSYYLETVLDEGQIAGMQIFTRPLANFSYFFLAFLQLLSLTHLIVWIKQGTNFHVYCQQFYFA